jgi:hypothetical protein
MRRRWSGTDKLPLSPVRGRLADEYQSDPRHSSAHDGQQATTTKVENPGCAKQLQRVLCASRDGLHAYGLRPKKSAKLKLSRREADRDAMPREAGEPEASVRFLARKSPKLRLSTTVYLLLYRARAANRIVPRLAST